MGLVSCGMLEEKKDKGWLTGDEKMNILLILHATVGVLLRGRLNMFTIPV